MNDLNPMLLPIAAFIRQRDGTFALKVRWLMGEVGDRLPRVDDRFHVRAELVTSGTIIADDANVQPHVYAMLDPPRLTAELDPITGLKWKVAREPEGPIVPICPAEGRLPDDAGFGVYHLLCEASKSRSEWRAARLLLPAFVEAFRRASDRIGRDRKPSYGDHDAQALARHIARVLVRGGHRPQFLPRILTAAVRDFAERLINSQDVFAYGDWSDPVSLLFPEDTARRLLDSGTPLVDVMEHVAFALEVWADEGLRRRLDTVVDEPAKLRGHLRIRALLGGSLLDFWCSPDRSVPADMCDRIARAKAHRASELLGLGANLGRFTTADLHGWIDANESVRIDVTHVPAALRSSASLDPGPRGEAGDLFDLSITEDGPLDPGTYVIPGRTPSNLPGLRRALLTGSSFPPLVPAAGSCRVNFDLIQVNAGSKPDDDSPIPFTRQVGFATGDGRFEIHIDKIADSDDKNVAGFNVYGVWELPETAELFQDPSHPANVSLPDLKKWLITRRYSYERDLKGGVYGLAALLPTSPAELPLPQNTTDPRLLAIVDPPPQSVSERPKAIIDEQNQDELPTGTRPLVTIFTHDLRTGMDSGKEMDRPSKFVGWDLDARIKTEWSPELTRDGTAASPWPQGYRFWVTAVDNLDQESAPVPVHTHDADAGEPVSYVFRPKRRTALPPPPDGQKIERTTLEADDRRFRLKISWETPFLNQVGQFGPTDPAIGRNDPERANRHELEGFVILFRRPLRADEVKPSGLANARFLVDSDPFELPQWQSVRNRSANEGWQPIDTWVLIDGGTFPDDTWHVEREYGHRDRAYEYRAAISLRVKEASPWRAYWMPPVIAGQGGAGRRLGLVHPDTGQPEAIWVTESPSATAVVETPVEAVSNPAEPRGAGPLSAPVFLAAPPVLPPPGFSRDLILMRLLALPFNGDLLHTWRDTGVPVTYGQEAMLDAALERTAERAMPAIPVGDKRLKFARLILARELQATDIHTLAADAAPPYAQHSTIGFRGLLKLEASYDPTDLGADESPPVAWVLRYTKAASDYTAATNFATFAARATRVEHHESRSVYELDSPGSALAHPGFAAIAESGLPSLARVDKRGVENVYVFGDLLSVEVTQQSAVRVTIGAFSGENPEFPVHVDLALFLAKPLIEDTIEDGHDPATLLQYLPVGGGPREIHCWWLGTRSAKGRETGPGRRRVVAFTAARTVEPSPPKLLRADPPRAGEDYALDPAQFGAWVPAGLSSLADALARPRVVLTWVSTEPDPSTMLLIEREERAFADPNTRAALSQRTPWTAIVAIGSADETQPLEMLDVDQLRSTWLKGLVVLTDGTTESQPKVHVGPDLTPHLSAQDGLKELEIPVELREEVSVLATATLILDSGMTEPVTLYNASATTIYLGDADVTSSNGSPLASGARLGMRKQPGDRLYGAVASGTARLDVLRTSVEVRPAFFDYFQHREADRSLVMDANLEYRYRVTAYLTVEAPMGAPAAWTRLSSSPTAWSSYTRPETAPIKIDRYEKREVPIADLGPKVTFYFEALGSVVNVRNAEESWRYRITVRRLRDFSIQNPGVPEDPGYEDVGSPIAVWPGQTSSVADVDIERSALDQPLDLEYEIIALQYRVESGGNGASERLIRSQSGSDGTSNPFHEALTIQSAAEDHENGVTLRYRLL